MSVIEKSMKEMKQKYNIDNICDHLSVYNIGIVALRLKESGRKSYVTVQLSEMHKFLERRGDIVCYEFGTLPGLVDASTRPKAQRIPYQEFMNEFIRTGNYFCSRILLEV